MQLTMTLAAMALLTFSAVAFVFLALAEWRKARDIAKARKLRRELRRGSYSEFGRRAFSYDEIGSLALPRNTQGDLKWPKK